MDTTMTRADFKDYYRHVYGTLDGWKDQWMDYKMNNTIADTNVCQSNQEVDKTMFIDECAPRAMKAKVIAPIANAQVIGNVPIEATQRDYTTERIKAIGEKHASALRKQFHMDGDRPQTALELIDFIKTGKYTLDEKMVNDPDALHYFNEYGINWGEKPDTAGYVAAKEVLKAAAQKAVDGATLKSVNALEGIINDFEAWVYTPAK